MHKRSFCIDACNQLLYYKAFTPLEEPIILKHNAKSQQVSQYWARHTASQPETESLKQARLSVYPTLKNIKKSAIPISLLQTILPHLFLGSWHSLLRLNPSLCSLLKCLQHYISLNRKSGVNFQWLASQFKGICIFTCLNACLM